MRLLKVTIVTLAIVTSASFVVSAYTLVEQQRVQARLCRTLNDSRGPDAGLKTDDPSAINTRAQLRDLWRAIGYPQRAALIPNASLLNCNTGQPIQGAP